MIYIALFYLLYLSLRLLIVLVNFFGNPYLPDKKCSGNKTVSVLVPARNEATNLPFLLGKLLAQTYKPLEILVYDDDSADGTWEVLESFAAISKAIHPIKGGSLPSGWLGKNHACFQLAKKAQGDYLMFLDADVRPESDLIERALVHIDSRKLKLLTLFPEQDMISLGEKITVPVMQNILLSLLPLPLVSYSHKPSLAAANGQFMFFEVEVYKKLQPHAWVKGRAVEDISIIRLYKKFHFQVETMLGNGVVHCRMYTSYARALQGFSKNFLSFFGNNYLFLLIHLTFSTLGWVSLLWLPLTLALLGFLGIFLLHTLLIKITGRSWIHILLAPVQQVNAWIMAWQAVLLKRKKRITWKQRIIPA